VLQRLNDHEITQKQAGLMLGLSDRQIRNILARYRQNGTKGIIHKLRNRPSNNQADPEVVHRILTLAQEELLSGYGPTELAEEFQQRFGIKVPNETIRRVLSKAGLWTVKKRKIRHRKWRERKESFGQMIQFDGSEHNWFEKRAPRCTLLLFIDDATSFITWASFASESIHGVMTTAHNYFLHYGIPCSLYTDRGSVYKVKLNNEENERITQFERALKQLDIEIIHARSPQAKGRVERCFGTLQRRLLHQLRANNISSIDEANDYLLNHYIPWHNTRYANDLKQVSNVHRPLQADLNDVLCIKHTRILQNDFTISYHKRILQITDDQQAVIRPKESITVCEHLDGQITLVVRGFKLNFYEIQTQLKPQPKTDERKVAQIYRKPAMDHPWRIYKNRHIENQNGGYFR
jgi:transposase